MKLLFLQARTPFRLSVVFQSSALLLLAAVQLFGQDTASSRNALTLDACIERAHEASPEAEIVRKNFEARTWDFRAWEAQFLPQLSLQANTPGLDRSVSIFQGQSGTEFRETSQLFSTFSLNLRQRIPFTGGEISVSSELTNSHRLAENTSIPDTLRPPAGPATTWTSSPILLSYTQPLFQFNSMKWEQKMEPKRHKVARKQFAEEMESITVDVTGKFFELYIAQMNLETARFNVQVNDTIFQLSRGRYEVGKIAENDLLQSELSLLNSQIRVSEAELSYELAQQDLNIALGYDRLREIAIVIPTLPSELDIETEFAIEQARQYRSDVLNFEIRSLEAERSVVQAEENNGFTADIRASAGLNKGTSPFSEVYSDLQDQQRFTVSLSMPILQWGKGSAEVESAIANRQSTQKSIELQNNDFEQGVYVQVKNFLQAQRKIAISAKSDTIAQRRFEVAKNRFLIGKIDITDLFNAQNEKDSARQSFVQALRTYWVAYYRLRQLTLYDFIRNRPLVQE